MNQSQYNEIYKCILGNKRHSLLLDIGNQPISETETKFTNLQSRILFQIQDYEMNKNCKLLHLFREFNILNIEIFVFEMKGSVHFGIKGTGIIPFISSLMTFNDYKLKKVCKPFTLRDYTKVYPYFLKYKITNMVANFRLWLEYLNTYQIRVTSTYDQKLYGILGCEVELTIPESLNHLNLTKEHLLHQNNPVKIKEGVFLFNKNGVSDYVLQKLLKKIHSFQSSIYPDVIIESRVKQFQESNCSLGINIWRHHARVMFKHDNVLYLIDPWMKRLPFSISSNFPSHITFIPRIIKDQPKLEGSCALSAVSRCLYMAFETDDIMNQIHLPIPDIYAFLTSHFYKTIHYKNY